MSADRPTPALADYGPVQLGRRLGWDRGEVERAGAAGVIPAPDVDGRRWSAELVEQIAADAPVLRAQVPPAPVGAERAARRLAERTGLGVERGDIEAFADAGLLAPAGWFKGWPLYHLAHIDALAELEGLAEVIRGGRLLTGDQAAERLGVRRRDFERMAAWGWISPARHVDYRPPWGRRVTVALYRVADVEALAARDDVDWAVLRALRPGQRSPLATHRDSGERRR